MLKRARRALVLALTGSLAALLAVTPAAAQKQSVVIYTAIENEQIAEYKKAYEKALPNLDVKMLRLSTGDIAARFMAEKDNMQADLIWGVGATNMLQFKNAGLLEPYAPKGLDRIQPLFRDKANPPSWVGIDIYMSAFCVNTEVAKKNNLPMPASWADLTKPVYKGQVVMPNPASSGTGYQAVYAWTQMMGEKQAWEFMDKLHQNIAVYTHSGSAPCVQAAKGERIIGIGFDMRGAKEKTGGAPIDIIMAKEGAPWDMEATAIMKGTKNLAAAQKLADFAVSKPAYELYGKYYAILGYPGINAAPPNYPPSADAAMAKIDLAKMGEERAKILAEWTKRYDGKSAPK